MIGARVCRVAAVSAALLIAGCGSAASRTPALSSLPLVPGARIVSQARQCDPGTNSYCALILVLAAPRFRSSSDLLEAQHRRLRTAGWSSAAGDTGEQRAAESPGNKLRVTYATADGDLKGVDLGWIQRPRKITLALSRALFDRLPALSVMLELGSRRA